MLSGKVWRTGQWAVDKNLYPADKYPTYCNGPCYLMPSLTASRLHDLVSVTPSDLQADDAFISGVLRSKAAIPLIQYHRNASPGFCRELNNRKPRLPRRMRREFERRWASKFNPLIPSLLRQNCHLLLLLSNFVHNSRLRFESFFCLGSVCRMSQGDMSNLKYFPPGAWASSIFNNFEESFFIFRF